MTKLPSEFVKTAKICGIEHALNNKGHFHVEKNSIISEQMPKGVVAVTRETNNGVVAEIVVGKGVKIKEPLFFCFGLKGTNENQMIETKLTLEEGAEVEILAHCSFPNASKSSHKMKAGYEIGKNAKLIYKEHHYHGKVSGILVMPKLKVNIDEGGVFLSDFVLSKGSVGQVGIEVEVILAKNAKSEISSKVFGKSEKDIISIIDKVTLEGENSKSLVTMRAAAKDGGRVFMQGETYASGANSIGHIDCQEIVSGEGSVAKAVPIVEVSNDKARVTHEASVGKINQKELETLMTRGMDEEEATELIIEAMMR
ncbi:SufD family Fe-S cluster assembly protein [bacterium]|jgi:uncharacterized protein|nr:SufD family Fe-S cluster assembly protein [bacterium]MBT4251284.1 SufD family Fe-S cluster assembly protein [bacterium]MBT4598335.1 SufD family Fe-S cluster assembly protein [bacterium]MBT6754168.1 SufD family Fe-S cluster assembly protein [bacterium]MBT7037226.1 SufD family Fe-S cluster assembly protein [bacterium]